MKARLQPLVRPLFRLAAKSLSWCAASLPALAQTNSPQASVEIPLAVRHGVLMVEARVNGSKPLTFKLDTGFGITTIHPELIKPLNLSHAGTTTILGIAGEEEADTYGGAVFDFGGMTYSPKRVAVLPSEARRRGRHRDGILGAGLFRRFVVELDIPHQRMRLYEPEQFHYTGKGEVFTLEFKKTTPIVEAVIVPKGRGELRGRFEIDTGCDGGVCVGHEFVAENHLLENKNSGSEDSRRGIGGSARTHPGDVSELRLGSLVVKNPSASFFLEGSPAGDGQAGHIGLGALEGYKAIFDYSRKQLILEP